MKTNIIENVKKRILVISCPVGNQPIPITNSEIQSFIWRMNRKYTMLRSEEVPVSRFALKMWNVLEEHIFLMPTFILFKLST